MPTGPLALLWPTLCPTSLFHPREVLSYDFRCLSTEQLLPQAPMLKLWRQRMSVFLAYVSPVHYNAFALASSDGE